MFFTAVNTVCTKDVIVGVQVYVLLCRYYSQLNIALYELHARNILRTRSRPCGIFLSTLIWTAFFLFRCRSKLVCVQVPGALEPSLSHSGIASGVPVDVCWLRRLGVSGRGEHSASFFLHNGLNRRVWPVYCRLAGETE